MITRSVSLSHGIAPNPASHITGLSSLATVSTSKLATWRPGTVDVRLAAVRRLAYEAADSGLLSPELAAGLRGVKRGRRQWVSGLGIG